MATFSTVVRHFFSDYVTMARNQKIQAKFNKEFWEAQRKQNQTRIRKLTEMQPEIMAMNMKNMKTQLKSMAVTLFVLISTFTWLGYFIGSLGSPYFTVPWAPNVPYNDAALGFLPYWIVLYSLLSIPLGMVIGRVLKTMTFRRRLRELEGAREWS